MIQLDRLEKIIKNNIPFWYIEDNQVRETHQAKYWKIAENKIVWYADNDLYRTFETIFETEADAKWYLEFGNIVREEKLSLPSWEKIKYDDIGYFIYKFHIKNNYNFFGKLMLWKMNNGTGKIVVEEMVQGWQEKIYFEKPLTKENYFEACKLCKQLFLGEKV